MGYTTKLSDDLMERGWTVGPVADGYDVDAERENTAKKSKKVEGEKKVDPTTTTAKTKSK